MAIVSKTTALLLLCTAVIASGSLAPNPSPRRTGSGSGSGSGSTTLAPTLAPSNAPTKYPTGAPANTPTSTPTVGYTAAATQITQTIVQTIPGVDSAATFNAEPNVKSAYEKGYGSQIGVTDTASNGAVTYKTGCSVDAWAADATRRAAMNVQYSSVVSDASGVDTTTASNGVTDTSAFAAAVATVVASDTTTYAGVTAPSATDITSVGTVTSVSISGGTVAPTNGPSDDSSDMDPLVIILLVIGGLLVIGMIVVIVVRLRVPDIEPKGTSTEMEQKSFTELKTAELATNNPPLTSFDEVEATGDNHEVGINVNDDDHSGMHDEESGVRNPTKPIG